MTNKWQDYKFPEWGKQKMGEYAQPVENTWPPGEQEDTGYPQTDVDMDNIWVKGKYPKGTKKKTREMMRGYGAATKGRMFYPGKG
jgi:hypothetical protein